LRGPLLRIARNVALLAILLWALALFIASRNSANKLSPATPLPHAPRRVWPVAWGLVGGFGVIAALLSDSTGLYDRFFPPTQTDGIEFVVAPTPQPERVSEYVFGNQYYYLQVLTDRTDRVIAYGVTTRRADFNPEFSMHQQRVQLGRTRFGEITSEPSNVFGYLDANRYTYHEEYYFGNPGLYQTYFVGINDSAPSTMSRGAGQVLRRDLIDVSSPAVLEFRNESSPNTFFVSALVDWPLDDAARTYLVGPNAGQVRALPETALATDTPPERLIADLRTLTTEVTIDYYLRRFGEPLIKNADARHGLAVRDDMKRVIFERRRASQ
jgi:hypothetical protein